MGKDKGEGSGAPVVSMPVLLNVPCADCGKEVGAAVDPWQLVGDGTFRCVECRAKRIREKAQKDIAVLKEKAAKATDEARQQTLPVEE